MLFFFDCCVVVASVPLRGELAGCPQVKSKMWFADEMGISISLEKEELEIARLQPGGGSAACIASDGLFDFGAHTEKLCP